MRKRVFASLVILLFSLLNVSCSAAGRFQGLKDQVADMVRTEMSKGNIKGLAIALVDGSGIVYADGFGYADVEKRTPVTTQTVFHIGSITKTLTAAATMQLVEQGRMDLDKPLQTYLPAFSLQSPFPTAGPITPRNILTHHSGIVCDILKGFYNENPIMFTEYANLVQPDDLSFPTNYVYSYSNIAVGLLGHAVQNVAGAEFTAHMQRSLFEPLGMKATSFYIGKPLPIKSYSGDQEVLAPPTGDLPAGGILSSVLDMSNYAQMLIRDGRFGNQVVLRPESVAEMFRPQAVDVPLDFDHLTGLIWVLNDDPYYGRMVWHNGGSPGLRSMMALLPDRELGAIVLANSSPADVEGIAQKALDLMLAAKTGRKRPNPPTTAPPAAVNLTEDQIQQYVGDYTNPYNLFSLTSADGQVRLIDGAGRGHTTQARADGHLYVPDFGLELSRADVAGQQVVLNWQDGKRSLFAVKLTPAPIPAVWRNRIGMYVITNLDGDYPTIEDNAVQISVVGGYFVATDRSGRVRLPLSLIADDQAVTVGLWRRGGERFRFVQRNGEERLLYTGYEFRKIN